MRALIIGVVLLAAAAPGASSAVEDAVAAAMAAGDECEDSGDGACALNEMQLRGQKASTGANPIYCKYLPPDMQSPWCNPAVNTCGCKQYCTASVAPVNWGWDPNCCLCGAPGAQPSVASEQPTVAAEQPTVAAEPAPAGDKPATKEETLKDMAAGGFESNAAGGFEAMTHPAYCHSLPSGVTSPWCSPGVNTCHCQGYCTASVRPQDWGWDPNCCGCGGHHAHGGGGGGGSCAVYSCGIYVKGRTCQCNSECHAHSNCCGDYQARCGR